MFFPPSFTQKQDEPKNALKCNRDYSFQQRHAACFLHCKKTHSAKFWKWQHQHRNTPRQASMLSKLARHRDVWCTSLFASPGISRLSKTQSLHAVKQLSCCWDLFQLFLPTCKNLRERVCECVCVWVCAFEDEMAARDNHDQSNNSRRPLNKIWSNFFVETL